MIDFSNERFELNEKFNLYRNFRDRLAKLDEIHEVIGEDECKELREILKEENLEKLKMFQRRMKRLHENRIKQLIMNRKPNE